MSSFLSSIFFDALPHVPLDKGVIHSNTGYAILDALPLITMLPCLPTLGLFFHTRRFGDFLYFLIGFLLAVVYHICHIDGLATTVFWGLPGSFWRSLDILFAQSLLSRTLGHAVGAKTSFVSAIYNAVFPTLLMVWSLINKRIDGTPPLTLGSASKTFLFVALAGMASKIAFEGASTLPAIYSRKRGRVALMCFFGGFLVFPLPEFFPPWYWAFHSLWHILMAAGYYLLYQELLKDQALEAKRMNKEKRQNGNISRHNRLVGAIAKLTPPRLALKKSCE